MFANVDLTKLEIFFLSLIKKPAQLFAAKACADGKSANIVGHARVLQYFINLEASITPMTLP